MSSDDKKEDKLIEGHTYDGIQEYDNPMPRWWVNLFWATIVFSIGYCGYYMTGIGQSDLERYREEVALAEAEKESTPAAENQTVVDIGQRLIAAARSDDSIKAGKAVFDTRCMPCHGDKGQGLIGPNFTDNQWLHGGSMEEIFHIVNVGVPAKGMVPWEAQLSEEERINVVAFIRSIQGTNVTGKAPEGEVSEPTPLN